MTADTQASFVAEGAEAPVTDPNVDELTITPAKAVGLTVITNELAADSSPSALQVVGDGLLRELIRRIVQGVLRQYDGVGARRAALDYPDRGRRR